MLEQRWEIFINNTIANLLHAKSQKRSGTLMIFVIKFKVKTGKKQEVAYAY